MKRPLLFCLVLLSPFLSLCGQEPESVEVTETITDNPVPYREPGEALYWQAISLLQGGEASWGEGRELLEEAASLDYTPAMVELASCYATEKFGFPERGGKAIKWMLAAAELGNGFAMVNMAQVYFSGWKVFKNHDKAQYWAERAFSDDAHYTQPVPADSEVAPIGNGAEGLPNLTVSMPMGDPANRARNMAWSILGDIARDAGDPVYAVDCYVKASDLDNKGRDGNIKAALLAAGYLALGEGGVPRDLKKAEALLQVCEEMLRSSIHETGGLLFQGNAINQYDLSDWHEQTNKKIKELQISLRTQIGDAFATEGTAEFNPRETAGWYTLAAEHGSAYACEKLGHLYLIVEYGIYSPSQARGWFRRGWEDHELPASGLNYAICLINGIGGEPDPLLARAILEKIGPTDYVACLLLRGEGPTEPLDAAAALKLNRHDADARFDADAQFCMGFRYQTGNGVIPSVRKAEDYYIKAIVQGHPGAMTCHSILINDFGHRLATPDMFNPMELLERAKDLGYPEASFQLAYRYSMNTHDKASLLTAVRLYEDYLQMKPLASEGMNNLANLLKRLLESRYFLGDPVGERETTARMVSLYEQSDEAGNLIAGMNLGELLYFGHLVERDYQRAYSYFEAAASDGEPKANFRIAEMFRKGEGVGIDYEKAAFHYRRCFTNNRADEKTKVAALTYLIEFHQSGLVRQRNPAQSLYWIDYMINHSHYGFLKLKGDLLLANGNYQAAIEYLTLMRSGEHPAITAEMRGYACARLGKCYEEGIGVRKNNAKAKAFYEWAVYYGDPDGYFWAARMTDAMGDAETGLQYMEMAARHGSAEACFHLARTLLNTDAREQSVEKGMRYLRKAVRLHKPEAFLLMARTTLDDLAGAPDLREAIRLATQALNLGVPKADQVLNQLELRLREKRDGVQGDPYEQRIG